MGRTRRPRRANDLGLTVIDGGLTPAADPHAGAPGGEGERGITPAWSSDGELSDLRQAMVESGVPEETLRVIDTAANPEEALARLVEAGVVPSEEETLEALLSGWHDLLGPDCDQLTAELCGVEFLAILKEFAPDEDATVGLLTRMLQQAEASSSPEGLAMARVMAVLGPESIREAAATAAGRLSRSGLPDQPWVRGLGSPSVGQCFGYADVHGQQEAVAVTFRYGRKHHGIAILIDHNLGGGVKDCWVTDRPGRVRSEYQQAAASTDDVEFFDYEPAQVRSKLEAAMSRPPCPADPEQIQDVRDFLDLLRQRVHLLPQAGRPVQGPSPVRLVGKPPAGGSQAASVAPAAPAAPAVSGGRSAAQRTAQPASGGRGTARQGTTRQGTARTIHRIKITLRGSKPPIWRRLEFPSTGSLRLLHESIQESFGWEDYHLWVFDTAFGEYGVPDPDLGHRGAATKKLTAVAPAVGEKLRYTYDFGDNWVHEILVEEILDAQPGVAYPRCVAGRRACPPEDCGGLWGYEELLSVVANPRHPEYEDRRSWMGLAPGESFDPAAFDVGEADAALSGIARVLVPPALG